MDLNQTRNNTAVDRWRTGFYSKCCRDWVRPAALLLSAYMEHSCRVTKSVTFLRIEPQRRTESGALMQESAARFNVRMDLKAFGSASQTLLH